jgi:hypothetical protein
MSTQTFELNGEEYEIPTRQATAIAGLLARTWSQLGKPETVISESGKKLMTVVISAWEDSFPLEVDTWKNQRQEELLNERSLKESTKQGGMNTATYPYWLFQMMRWAFPKERWAKPEVVSYLLDNFPVFKTSNYTGANYKGKK